MDIVESRSPSFLFDDAVLITGEVPRVTGYEPGLPPQQAWIGDRWQSDSLVLDDQAMILHVRDRGLVVLTGCGHAGIVNTARYAKELTGGDSIHALVGGFHLSGKLFSPIIPQVVRDIEALHPNYVVPGHCTGWQAQGELIRSFGDRALPSSVGMHLELGGAS